MERERLMKIEERFRTAVRVARVLYALAGAAVAVCGALRQNSYSLINALCTFLLIPALWAARRLLRWEGGWQIELFVYAFACLGWTLGGAAECYETIPHFDKLVHMLSGVFVSMLALALFRMLERERPIAAQGKATACLLCCSHQWRWRECLSCVNMRLRRLSGGTCSMCWIRAFRIPWGICSFASWARLQAWRCSYAPSAGSMIF